MVRVNYTSHFSMMVVLKYCWLSFCSEKGDRKSQLRNRQLRCNKGFPAETTGIFATSPRILGLEAVSLRSDCFSVVRGCFPRENGELESGLDELKYLIGGVDSSSTPSKDGGWGGDE